MLRRRASIVILAFALAACARATNDAEAPGSVSAATGPATTGPADIGLEDVEGVAPDPAIWDRPLGPIGVQISSSDSPALDDLAYKPVLPSDDLGSPTAVYVSDVGVVGKAAQQIAWVYDDATAGRYIVIESPSGASQADLEEPAHLAPGCRTTASEIEGADTHIECVPDDFSLVKLNDGVVALAVQNEYVTSLSWLKPMEVRDSRTFAEFATPTVEIKFMAPAGKATLDELTSLANRFQEQCPRSLPIPRYDAETGVSVVGVAERTGFPSRALFPFARRLEVGLAPGWSKVQGFECGNGRSSIDKVGEPLSG